MQARLAAVVAFCFYFPAVISAANLLPGEGPLTKPEKPFVSFVLNAQSRVVLDGYVYALPEDSQNRRVEIFEGSFFLSNVSLTGCRRSGGGSLPGISSFNIFAGSTILPASETVEHEFWYLNDDPENSDVQVTLYTTARDVVCDGGMPLESYPFTFDASSGQWDSTWGTLLAAPLECGGGSCSGVSQTPGTLRVRVDGRGPWPLGNTFEVADEGTLAATGDLACVQTNGQPLFDAGKRLWIGSNKIPFASAALSSDGIGAVLDLTTLPGETVCNDSDGGDVIGTNYPVVFDTTESKFVPGRWSILPFPPLECDTVTGDVGSCSGVIFNTPKLAILEIDNGVSGVLWNNVVVNRFITNLGGSFIRDCRSADGSTLPTGAFRLRLPGGDVAFVPPLVVRELQDKIIISATTFDGNASCSFIDSPLPDADGDGLPDAFELVGDSDGDGTTNYLDPDDDGDGISTFVEGSGDADNDGIPNYLDLDSDNDGIPDSVEGTSDADNDGIPDRLECNTCDTDGDGNPDSRDTDTDNDGIPDGEEGPGDDDNDGIPNFQDTDKDGDGIPDAAETGDADNDGLPDYCECNTCDNDGDGIVDSDDPDSDNDGIPDGEEGTGDSDGDGIPNHHDGDQDGDGVPSDGEGTGDSDGDGVPDADECGTCDSDGDGIPDSEDPDSDGDGIPDGDEGNVDNDGDGLPAIIDPDDNGNGIPDGEEEFLIFRDGFEPSTVTF